MANKYNIQDVKTAAIEAVKRAGQLSATQVLMGRGGKITQRNGKEAASLQALPPENYESTIAALKTLKPKG